MLSSWVGRSIEPRGENRDDIYSTSMIDYHSEYILILDDQSHPLPAVVLDDGKVGRRQAGFCGEELKVAGKQFPVSKRRGRSNARHLHVER